MSTYKSGHPVLGIILGVVGILAALPLIFLSGVIGGVIVGVLGLVALLLGIGASKFGKGKGAIITGVLAIILALSVTASVTTLFTELRAKAEATGQAPLVVKTLDKPHLALVGMILNLPEDEGGIDELFNQLNLATQDLNGTETSTDSTSEPAAEPADAAPANP